MKTCPYCAEEVKDKAIICKHCHSDLITGNREKVVKITNIVVRRLIVIYFSIFLSILGLVTIYAIIEPTLTSANNQKELEKINKKLEHIKAERAYQEQLKQAEEERQKKYEEEMNKVYYLPSKELDF